MDANIDSESRNSIAPSTRSFLSRAVTFRHAGENSRESDKGKLGLITIYQPLEEAVGDLVFIHGLGGGSRKTWTKDEDPNLFWPQEWLPRDPEFRDVRIHTFGYDSNWKLESILNIHDFAKSLLHSLKDCPAIPREATSPLMLVCHSLGGLVAKRAYVLSRQLKEYHGLSTRIQSIFFLGTPHRGSNMAEVLSRILQVAPNISVRPYVNDLHPNSATIQSINDEFPHHCQDLQLHSFYETNPMALGIKKIVIVPKDSAVLGYSNERSTYLNANHRELCKYGDDQDANYRSVRNSLASTWDLLRRSRPTTQHDTDYEMQQWLKECLDVDDVHENDYEKLESERIPGSCAWIAAQSNFQQWLNSSDPHLYWLTAKPGTGKSIVSSFVINFLKEEGKSSTFYMFSYSDKSRLSIGMLLRSIAWQLCSSYSKVFDFIQLQCKKDPQLPKADYRTIWRKLFLEGIFRLDLYPMPYLVIDAIDECKNVLELVPLLAKAAEINSIRIFVTSRQTFESYGGTCSAKVQAMFKTISQESTAADIKLYVKANASHLPALGSDRELARGELIDSILAKSCGCFLWVRLVISELRRVHTAAEVRKVLEEVPSDMNELYERILSEMSNQQYGKSLGKAILAWVTCSARPLSADELHQALQLDIGDNIDSVRRTIASTCGQLVYVDGHSRVQLVHQTAREVLLHPETDSEFAMGKAEAHKRLILVCLKYLCGPEMGGQKPRKLSATAANREPSTFASYASSCLGDHMAYVSSEDDDILHHLARFLNSSNVLAWIEFLAKNNHLERLIHAGTSFNRYLQRRNKHGLIPLGRDIALLDAWSIDLVRLVTKFGRNLSASPSSIHVLIPPFCPAKSAINKQFGASKRYLEVSGLSQTLWDDCSSVIMYQNEFPAALACSSSLIAVGLASGSIKIHENATTQELHTLWHNEPVKALLFGDTGVFLASIAFKSICIWNTDSWQQMWRFQLDNPCMDLIFFDNDRLLVAATRDNQLLAWDLSTGSLGTLTSWLEELEGGNLQSTGRPSAITISRGLPMLAVVYRGEDIIVWDMENEQLHDFYGQDVGSLGIRDARRSGVAFVHSLAFSKSDSGLLAASYNDGELVIFNTTTSDIQARTYANGHTMNSSPDGLTLACGNSAGMILIYEFETLKLRYRINLGDSYGIKALTYSADSLRLLDIRGPFLRVWEPSVLANIQQEDDEQSNDTMSTSTAVEDYNVSITETASIISALVCLEEHEMIICGRLDGSLSVFDGKTGKEIGDLIQKANAIAIKFLLFDIDSSTLIAADLNNRITAYRMKYERSGWKSAKLFLHRVSVPISHMIANEGFTRLLVSSQDGDHFYNIDAESIEELATLSFPGRQSFRWITHPQDASQLVLLMDSACHIYSWDALLRTTSEAGILLTGALLSELRIRAVVSFNAGSLFATTFSESPAMRSRSKLFLFRTSDITPTSISAAPIPQYQPLADQVEHLIGLLGPRIVFLNREGWVCSADASVFDAEAVDRHFFFPTDWLSAAGGLMFGLFKSGSIAFVQRNEVAIIKRGLDYVENASSKASIGKRSSVAGSSRLSDPGMGRISLVSSR